VIVPSTAKQTPKAAGSDRVSAFTSLASNINQEGKGKKGLLGLRKKSYENSMRLSEVVARKGAGVLTSRGTEKEALANADNSNANKALRR
jgi:hypothetical protein